MSAVVASGICVEIYENDGVLQNDLEKPGKKDKETQAMSG